MRKCVIPLIADQNMVCVLNRKISLKSKIRYLLVVQNRDGVDKKDVK